MPHNMENVERSSSQDDLTATNNKNENTQLSANYNSSQAEENNAFQETTSANSHDASSSVSQTAVVESCPDESLDDEPDETLTERLWGLTEMFPEPMRVYAGKVSSFTKLGVSKLYTISCNAAWIVVSSAVILFAPAIFESERAQVKELQKSQEKQVLLGPAVVMGSNSARVKSN